MKFSDFYDATNVLTVFCPDSDDATRIVGIPHWITDRYFTAKRIPGDEPAYSVQHRKSIEAWEELANNLKSLVHECEYGLKNGYIEQEEIDEILKYDEERQLKAIFYENETDGKLHIPNSEYIENLVGNVAFYVYNADPEALPWKPTEAEKKALYQCVKEYEKRCGTGEFDVGNYVLHYLKSNFFQKVLGIGVPITYIIFWDTHYDSPCEGCYRVYSTGENRSCFEFNPQELKWDEFGLSEYEIDGQIFHSGFPNEGWEYKAKITLEKDARTSLQYFRKKKKLSAKQLAARSRVNQRTIEDYEQKRRPIWKARVDIIMRLAKVLQVQPEDILDYWEE